MPDLCKIENVKEWLQVPQQNDKGDGVLTRLIAAISAEFLNAIDRQDLTPKKTYTDVLEIEAAPRTPRWMFATDVAAPYSRTARAALGLNHWPIVAIGSVTVDGTAIAQSSDGVQNGWFVDMNQEDENRYTLHLINTPGRTAVVTYDAGYDQVPADIEQAVIEWVSYRYTSRQWIGQISKHLGAQGETVSYQNVDMPPTTKSVIERYTRSEPLL